MKPTYTTGKFAKLAGVSERTVRYYDEQGLLKPSFIMENGYRCYLDSDFIKIKKILTLKYLGFSLNEIKLLIMEEDRTVMKDSLDMQISMIDQKIQHMNALKDSLVSAKQMLNSSSIDWNEFADLIDLKEQDEKIIEHYRNANNLSIRIHLHEMYSTNQKGWFPWLLEHIDFQHIYRMLEVGCGNGAMWKNCSVNLRNREIFLSDISEGMIDYARQQLGEDYSYMVFDCQKIPFRKDYFDAVMANHMLFYVNDLSKALSEITRVLKPKGICYCSAYGKHHMKEITEIAKRFDTRITLSDQILSDRFGLEHGAKVLEPYFEHVECVEYEDALEITDAKPLFDYIMSCHGNQHELLSNRLDEFIRYLEDELKQTASIHITKQAGLFICTKK